MCAQAGTASTQNTAVFMGRQAGASSAALRDLRMRRYTIRSSASTGTERNAPGDAGQLRPGEYAEQHGQRVHLDPFAHHVRREHVVLKHAVHSHEDQHRQHVVPAHRRHHGHHQGGGQRTDHGNELQQRRQCRQQ